MRKRSPALRWWSEHRAGVSAAGAARQGTHSEGLCGHGVYLHPLLALPSEHTNVRGLRAHSGMSEPTRPAPPPQPTSRREPRCQRAGGAPCRGAFCASGSRPRSAAPCPPPSQWRPGRAVTNGAVSSTRSTREPRQAVGSTFLASLHRVVAALRTFITAVLSVSIVSVYETGFELKK